MSLLKRPGCRWFNAIGQIGASAGTSIMRIGEALRAGVRKAVHAHTVTSKELSGGMRMAVEQMMLPTTTNRVPCLKTATMSMLGINSTTRLSTRVNRPGPIPTIRVVSTSRNRGNQVRASNGAAQAFVLPVECSLLAAIGPLHGSTIGDR